MNAESYNYGTLPSQVLPGITEDGTLTYSGNTFLDVYRNFLGNFRVVMANFAYWGGRSENKNNFKEIVLLLLLRCKQRMMIKEKIKRI